MNKPVTIRIMNIILIAKLIMFPLLCGTMIVMMMIHSDGGFIYGFQGGYLDAAGLDRSDLDNSTKMANIIGGIVGSFLLPFGVTLLCYLLVKKGKFIASLVAFALQVLLGLNIPFLLIINVVLLILLIVSKKHMDRGATYQS